MSRLSHHARSRSAGGSQGLVQRMVFYGCELYAGQLKSGDEYENVNPVYTIWRINGILWPDAAAVHHAFRLTDKESGRAWTKPLRFIPWNWRSIM